MWTDENAGQPDDSQTIFDNKVGDDRQQRPRRIQYRCVEYAGAEEIIRRHPRIPHNRTGTGFRLHARATCWYGKTEQKIFLR